mgnify:FL=1
MMANEFIYENVNAYLYWNGVWVADLGNCLIEVDDDKNGDIRRVGNHYIMMHFSKYIKRGYQRVEVENSSGATVVAFKAPDSHRLVIVAVNNKDSYEDLYVDLGGAVPTGSSAYQTIGNESRFKFKYWQDAGQFNPDGNELPPLSVTTFVIDLPADPNYVAPVEDTAVNPFVKQPGAVNTGLIIGIAAGAVVVIVIVVAVVAASGKKKKAAKSK